jgi:hypothetical protein
MAMFMIVPINNPLGIEHQLDTLKASGGLDFIKLPVSGFMVSYHGTAQELSSVVGITDGTSGTAVVASISSYYGRAPTDIWDWVKTRWEA